LFNTVLFGAFFLIRWPHFFDIGVFLMVAVYTLGFGLPVMTLLGFPLASRLERRDVQSPLAWVAVHIVIGCVGMLLCLAVVECPAQAWRRMGYDFGPLLLLAPAALTAAITGLGYWFLAIRQG